MTIRVERPDGQFVTASRDVPGDLGPDPEVAERVTEEIAVEFVRAYGRAARLPDGRELATPVRLQASAEFTVTRAEPKT